MEKMGRSSIEAYGAIILAAFLAELTWAGIIENMSVVILSSIVVLALLVDVVCRSPVSILWSILGKIASIVVLSGGITYGDFVLYQHHLEKEQEDAFRNITADARMPPSNDGFQSTFTVTNGSGLSVGKHNVTCVMNLIVGANKASIRGMTATMDPSGKFMALNATEPTYIQSPLEPGGSDSETCLASFEFPSGADCLDVTILFTYFLVSQNDSRRVKTFRFTARRGGRIGNSLVWDKQSVNLSPSPCEAYLPGGDPGRFH